jgi:hypothetical protein
MVTVVVPEVFTVVAGTEQVTPTSPETEQEKLTLPLKLLCGATVTVAVADVPVCMLTVAGLAETSISPNHCCAKLLASAEPQPVVWS